MLNRLRASVQGRVAREIKTRGYFRDLWYPRYPFQMFPKQLCFLAETLRTTATVPGGIVEIGCAHGLTTTFLYEYMIDAGFKKDYLCIDTFSGFTEADMAVEFDQRGNKHGWIAGMFKDNDPEWFKEALRARAITDVRVMQADVTTMSADRLPDEIAFCLLDVDLYAPVKQGLAKVYPRLSPGGIIVVDDCWSKPNHFFVAEAVADAYDGAMQAYREFTAEHGLPEELVETKLGVIRKPA